MAKYLIVGPSWVGDMVMAQSLFKTLHQRDTEAVIDVVAPPWSTPVLARMPEVRHSIPLAVAHREWGFFKRRKLGLFLREERYDHAIVLPRSWKSALVPFFAKIKNRVGFLGEMRYGLLTERRVLDKQTLDQTVKRFVSLGLPFNKAYPPEKIYQPKLEICDQNQRNLLARFGLDADKAIVVLMPGAEFGPAKQWPVSYYQEVAKKLCACNIQVCVVGGAADRADGEQIVQGLNGDIHNLCGLTNLDDAIDLIAVAQLAICNDSGLMHVAAAVETDVHVIYGSTSADFTPPLTEAATLHSLDLACSPCFQRRCRFGHYNCLRQLSPDLLMSGVMRNLKHGNSKL